MSSDDDKIHPTEEWMQFPEEKQARPEIKLLKVRHCHCGASTTTDSTDADGWCFIVDNQAVCPACITKNLAAKAEINNKQKQLVPKICPLCQSVLTLEERSSGIHKCKTQEQDDRRVREENFFFRTLYFCVGALAAAAVVGVKNGGVSIPPIPLGVWIGLGVAGYVGIAFLTVYVIGRMDPTFKPVDEGYTPIFIVSVLWPLTLTGFIVYQIATLGWKCYQLGRKHGEKK